MWKLAKKMHRNNFHRSSKGAALVEVVIAVVVLGLITASVPPVLILLNEWQFKWNEQTTSESLIRTQIEYLKGSPYIYGNITVPNPAYKTVPVPIDGYSIELEAVPTKVGRETAVENELLGQAKAGNGEEVFVTYNQPIMISPQPPVVSLGIQPLTEGSDYEIDNGRIIITNSSLAGNVYIDYWYVPHEPVNCAGGEKDAGLQEITVEVYHVDKLVLSAQNYKVDR